MEIFTYEDLIELGGYVVLFGFLLGMVPSLIANVIHSIFKIFTKF